MDLFITPFHILLNTPIEPWFGRVYWDPAIGGVFYMNRACFFGLMFARNLRLAMLFLFVWLEKCCFDPHELARLVDMLSQIDFVQLGP